MQTVTREQVVAALEMVVIIGQLIQEKKSIPDGELYAQLMDKFNLQTYNSIIDKLITAKCVKRSNNLLTWVGPA